MSHAPDSIRVLHVDDDPALTEMVAQFLEREDDRIDVVTESSAGAGLDRLADAEVDCVVSDYDMLGQDGIEFLEAVREDDADLPFILFTGKGSEEVASDAISTGVTDYLQKEVGTDQYAILANRIRNAVERTRAERERRRHINAIETAREGIGILDEDGRFIYVNEAYADLYRYDPGEMVGEHWKLVYRDEDVGRMREEVLPVVEERGHWHGTTTGLRADGTTFVEDHVLATTANDELVCTIRDATERTRRERAIENLHATAQDFIEAETAEVVADVAVEAVRDILDMPMNAVHLHDEATGRLAPVAWTEHAATLVGDLPAFEPGESLAWDVFETGEPRTYDDVSTVPGRTNSDTAIRSEVILPLGDHGVLLISSDEPGAFDERDVSLAKTVAAHATTALDSIERGRRLREERAFVDRAIDTLDDLYYVVGADGELRRWNDRVTAVTGYTDDEITGAEAPECFPDDECDRVADALDEALATGRATVEAEVQTVDGTRVPYEFTGARLTGAADDRVWVVGIGRDISARKRHERRLTELHAFAPDLLSCDTREEVCQRTIAAAKNVLEFDESTIDIEEDGVLSIAAISEGVSPDGVTDMSTEEGVAGKTFRTGESIHIDDVRDSDVAKPQESYRSALSIPIGDHGVFQTVSERPSAFDDADLELAELLASHTEKALSRLDREQELQRTNERLDEFASIVSHDLRNPLNVAQGRLELVREECDSDDLDAVVRAHDRMAELIEDLLTLAQQGESATNVTTVDLGDLADRCWQNVTTADATLVADAPRLRADSSHLRQLLENLFRNAVEHGGEAASIRVGELPDGDGFYVADDGPGIPEADRDRAFEPGYSTTSRGTGFGLNIVEQIAEAHGWTIRVTDGDEGGARFEFTGVELVDG